MKRLLALFISLLFILSSCTGNGGDINSDPSNEGPIDGSSALTSFSVPFSENDTLNPYTVKGSLNIALMPLMYDSLVTVSNDFSAKPLLAESIEKTSPTTLSVTIKSGVTFSNGQPLTAYDVVHSFYTGKSMGSYFSSALSSFSSASASGDRKVIFTLYSADRYAENNLDFPITYRGSGTDSPIGSGRYTLLSSGNTYSLIPNKDHFSGAQFTLEKIDCSPIPYNDSLFTAIKSGNIDIVPADPSLGSFIGTYCNTKSVNSSNLVYLGVSGSGALADISLRKYISASLNRQTVGLGIPVSTYTPSSLPLHPYKADIMELSLNQTENIKTADTLLPLDLFTKGEDGYLCLSGQKITLTLLYCSDSSEKNILVSSAADILRSAGIEVALVGKNYSEYAADVAARRFDLYLGETKLSKSLDLSALLSSSQFALSPSDNIKAVYNEFSVGNVSAADFLTAFSEELPFIPLMFKNTAVTYSKSVSSDIEVSQTDSYLSLQNIR